jgi:hypothetical protein
MQKPRLQDVLETISVAVAATIQASITAGLLTAPPAQCAPGKPETPELVKILTQGGYLVSVYPLDDGHQTSRYPPVPFPYPGGEPVTLLVEINPEASTITFSGTVTPGINVHTLVGALFEDAFYQSVLNDTLGTVATAVAAQIVALGMPGVGATASGAVVHVTGTPYLICNIGAATSSNMGIEVNRVQRGIEVTAWCPDPIVRYKVVDPIFQNIGTTDYPFLTLSDGTPLRIQYSGKESWKNDKSQSSYSLYEHHINFECEYGFIRSISGTPIQVVKQQIGINSQPLVTHFTATNGG